MTTMRWLLFLAVLFSFSPAYAQKWDVTAGDDRQQEIVKRYKTLLERTPSEGLAFTKLLDYVGKGKGLDRLIAEYQGRVDKQPDAANFRLILGHLFKAKNEYDKALAQYEVAVTLAGNDPLALLSRGSIHVLLQNGALATADFEGALALEKDKSRKQDILRKLADNAFAQRDWERAQKYYDQLVSLDPRNEYLRLEYAQVLVQYKRYDKALEQYESLLKLSGGDTKAKASTMRDIGDLYEKMGSDDKAIETYENAMKLMREGNWLHRELRQRIVGVYRRTDRLAELAARYAKQWKNPDYDEAMLLGTLFDELGQEDKALTHYKQAMARNRRATDPRLRVVRILERRGDDKAVIAAYNQLISVAPAESRFYFDLVRIHFRLGDRKAAEKMLQRIESRFARDPDVHVMLADTYMRFDMGKDALRIYRKLVRMDSRNDAYILGLGEYYYQNGEVDEALKTWEKLLSSSLEEAEAHARLGQVLAEHGLVEKGMQHYEKAVEIAPTDINVRRGLALAYEHARRWTQAIEAWTWLLERADQPLTANEARSRVIAIYQRQNKLNAKLREFAAAFSKDPNDLSAGFFLSEAYVKLVMYDKAETVLKQIVQSARASSATDHEVTALLSLERLYQQNNNLEAAIVALQRLAELLPARSREYYHRIADLSLKLYEDDQAVHYATLAVQMNPDDAMAQARLGDVYEKMGKFQAAAAQYRQAIDLDPRAFEITMKLAEILLEIGQLGEAETLYRTITKQANDESLALNASRKAIVLAELGGRLEEVEDDFYNLVYKTPPRPVYRKIMLELYDRMSNPYVARDRYGVPTERADAAAQLDAIGGRALPILIDALNAEEVGQRVLAVRLLGDLRQPNAALPLSRMVDDAKDALRMPAAIAVAQIGDPRGSAPLIRVTEDSNPAMRELATWALGAIGGQSAVERLAQILNAGQSWREQVMAAISLGRIGTPRAVDVLLAYYSTLAEARYADSTVVAVVWALGRSGDRRVVPTLTEALSQASDRVATVAAWSLAEVGGPEATRTLIAAHWSDEPNVRSRASRGLVQLASSSARPDSRRVDEIRQEIRFIDERNPNVEVELMLRELEQAAAVVLPTDATAFIDANAATLADIAGARLATAQGRDIVTRALLDVDGDLALGVLTSTPAPTLASAERRDQAVRTIITQLRPPLREVAQSRDGAGLRAVGLLGALGDPRDLSLVVERVAEADSVARRHALAALAGYPAKDVQAHLIAGLKDSDYRVRVAAHRSLGRVLAVGGDRPSGVEALRGGLADPYPTVRIAAATALGRAGDRAAAAPLIGAVDDQNLAVRVSVLRALRLIDTPEARKTLDRFARGSNLVLRRAASGAP